LPSILSASLFRHESSRWRKLLHSEELLATWPAATAVRRDLLQPAHAVDFRACYEAPEEIAILAVVDLFRWLTDMVGLREGYECGLAVHGRSLPQ
jgi:hypothetical protein